MPNTTFCCGDSLKLCKILVLLLIFQLVASIYSPYFKRCRINKGGVDTDAVARQDLENELFPNFAEKHMSNPIINPEAQLNYLDYNFFFHQYIGAGGSGEVYLVEDKITGVGKVVKRYFKERPEEFRRQAFLMKTLNYSMDWAKYCQGTEKCLEDDEDYNSIAIFPHKQSIIFRSLDFDAQEAPLIFYKILVEMDKIHRAGVIHNDIKMGNMMVNSIGPNFKFYEIQFIDWNLALLYHTGLDTNFKRGTVCFYSPQQLLRTQYVTPARDIWSLGIAMFTYYTDEKPFLYSCKKDNLKAVATLIGAEKLLALYKKYNYNSMEQLSLLNELQKKKQNYPEMDLLNFKLKVNKQSYTKDLVDVFKRMFEPDPEKRSTAEELLKMKYFSKVSTLPPMYYYKDLEKNDVKTQPTKKTNNTKSARNSSKIPQKDQQHIA